MTDQIKCGDTVFHKPTKETWIVCYADYKSGFLSWFGWPEGYVEISNCELVESCTPEAHKKEVALWVNKPFRRDDGTWDHRVRIVERLYGSVINQEVAND